MTVRLEERRWDDAEGMVLPWPKRVERWKVGVCMFSWRGVPSYARDVDADNVFCDLNYFCPAHAVLQNTGDTRTTVEEPHCARGVQPEFVTPPPTEEVFNMVPTPGNHENGEDDVHDEEDLVALSPEPQA